MKGRVVATIDFHNYCNYEEATLRIIGYQMADKDGNVSDRSVYKSRYANNFLSDHVDGAAFIDVTNENGERVEECFYYYRDEKFSDTLKRFFKQFGKQDEYEVTLLFGDYFYW